MIRLVRVHRNDVLVAFMVLITDRLNEGLNPVSLVFIMYTSRFSFAV